MNKKTLFIFGFCLAFILMASNFAQALMAPSVYVPEFNLSSPNTYFAEGNALSGNFIIWNSEDYIVPDVNYKILLIKKKTSEMGKTIVDEKISDEVFVLSPNKKQKISFNYSIPANIMSGSYNIRVELMTKKGVPLGWENIPIEIKGSDKFLTLSNAKVIKNNSEEHPTVGIGFEKNETVEIKFVGENPSANSIAAQCQITIYERMTNMNKVSDVKKESIVFAPGEKKVLQYKMPVFEKPESYLAEVKFYNVQDKAVSNIVYFRFVIKGISAEIFSIDTTESSYSKGDTAKVKVVFAGSADSITAIGNGEIKVKIYNKENEIVGEASKNLNIDKNNSVVFQIPIKKNTEYPRVEAAIIKGGAILDNYEINVNSISDFSIKKKKSNLPFYFLLILILGLISFFIYKKRNQNKPLWILFFAFIIFGTFFTNVNSSQAAYEVYSHNYPTFAATFTWSKPIRDQEFAPGDEITFSGKVFLTACGNTIRNHALDFYITTVPFLPDELTESPYNFPQDKTIERNERCEITATDEKIIELILKAEKTEKLGSFKGGDVESWEYEKTFTFPEGFEGTVYAMAYYTGYHCVDRWICPGNIRRNYFAIIAKEKIYVNPPINGPVAQIGCSPINCSAFKGEVFTLLNNSFDNETLDENLKSFWKVEEIGNPSNFRKLECSNKCNFTPQNFSIGNYNAYLRVEDEDKLSDETTKDFEIKKDIEASFKCSLSKGAAKTWNNCALIKPLTNQTVFFKDTSTASQKAEIDFWNWTFEDGEPLMSSMETPQTVFSSKDFKNVTLNVKDTAGRSDKTIEIIGIKIPMPKWKEVHPKTD